VCDVYVCECVVSMCSVCAVCEVVSVCGAHV